ncbi:MAG: hypothetical protein M0T74_05510 [Desulfitobacterium hafniense]|nr:hypothetical protein [Desulfitobacterium hafniense]
MLEEFRANIINKMKAVKTDPNLNNKEKDKKKLNLLSNWEEHFWSTVSLKV